MSGVLKLRDGQHRKEIIQAKRRSARSLRGGATTRLTSPADNARGRLRADPRATWGIDLEDDDVHESREAYFQNEALIDPDFDDVPEALASWLGFGKDHRSFGSDNEIED